MLQLRQTLINRPVMSLRTGAKVANATNVIINPNNLKIEGWYCQDGFNKKARLVLVAQEVRDIIAQGIVVNDQEALSEVQDLIRLQEIIKLGFELIGKPVVTAGGKHLGKVNDWAADSSSLFIQKLYVAQSLLKNFSGGSLSVDRGQIVEITNRKIVVNEPTVTEEVVAPATVPVV